MYKENYIKSLDELKLYIKTTKIIPNENEWNKYAKINKLLSSKSIQYGYEENFNKMCRELRKNNKKAHKNMK